MELAYCYHFRYKTVKNIPDIFVFHVNAISSIKKNKNKTLALCYD